MVTTVHNTVYSFNPKEEFYDVIIYCLSASRDVCVYNQKIPDVCFLSFTNGLVTSICQLIRSPISPLQQLPLRKLFNMFRATMCPSPGADDCVVLSPRVGIVPWLQEGCQNDTPQ